MVKLGFIVEGDTEKILLESEAFEDLLRELKIDYVTDIINAEGNGNLLPHNIQKLTQILFTKGASHILILTDLDQDQCVTETKNRIQPNKNHFCIVSKKQIESWFLADSITLSQFVESNIQEYENPEEIENPYEEIRKLKIAAKNRGFANKRSLANSMISKGFSFKRAAEHPNCSSAKYFIDKLIIISKQN